MVKSTFIKIMFQEQGAGSRDFIGPHRKRVWSSENPANTTNRSDGRGALHSASYSSSWMILIFKSNQFKIKTERQINEESLHQNAHQTIYLKQIAYVIKVRRRRRYQFVHGVPPELSGTGSRTFDRTIWGVEQFGN